VTSFTQESENVLAGLVRPHPERRLADHDAELGLMIHAPAQRGDRIGSPGPITEVDGLMKSIGSGGSGFCCSAAWSR
jgi:hypothetical protein